MEMMQGVWKQDLRPRAVVGYGVNIFLPSPPNYVTRSPGMLIAVSDFNAKKKASFEIVNFDNQYLSLENVSQTYVRAVAGAEHTRQLSRIIRDEWVTKSPG